MEEISLCQGTEEQRELRAKKNEKTRINKCKLPGPPVRQASKGNGADGQTSETGRPTGGSVGNILMLYKRSGRW